jgi:hypothetical protein
MKKEREFLGSHQNLIAVNLLIVLTVVDLTSPEIIANPRQQM